MGERNAAAMATLLTDVGWHRFILDRRAPEAWAMRLAEAGLCSSISHQPGANEWRLHLSKFGRAVRAVLETEAANA